MTKKELRQFLLDHSREQLSDWLLGVAKDSPDFRQRIEFYAGTHHSHEAASKAIARSVVSFNAMVQSRHPLKSADIVKSAQFLLESMRACMDMGPMAAMMPMLVEAMKVLDELIGKQSKPGVRLDELQSEYATFHLRLAKQYPLDPVALAESLFALRSTASGKILPEAPGAYIEVLGEAGTAHYRKLLEPTYQVVVNQQSLGRQSHRETLVFLNRRVMLFEWTMVTEDIDEQVAILLAMAKHPDEVLTVAHYLDLRQRPMDALQTVQKAFHRVATPKLATFMAERLEKQNQVEDALPYRWYLFEQSPSFERFGDLMQAAGQVRQHAHWRDRAMGFAAEKAKALRIEILLSEDELDKALSEARLQGAPISIWTQLAERHVIRDPRIAIELYFDCAEFSLKERKADSSIALAWHLAVDGPTFQIFNARLRALFGKQKLPDWYVAKLVEAGIPVAKLLE